MFCWKWAMNSDRDRMIAKIAPVAEKPNLLQVSVQMVDPRPDGLSSLQDIGAIAALTQCLVDDMSTTLDNGGTIPVMPPWYRVENKWRAARYGLRRLAGVHTGRQEPDQRQGRQEPARAEPPEGNHEPESAMGVPRQQAPETPAIIMRLVQGLWTPRHACGRGATTRSD